jgi:hypothetical protein
MVGIGIGIGIGSARIVGTAGAATWPVRRDALRWRQVPGRRREMPPALQPAAS